MLTSVVVTGDPASVLTLPISTVTGSDPIQIRNIDGLGPVKADIITTSMGNFAESFSGSTVGKRNIVITFGLNPNWNDQTMESLRTLLYKYFMPRQKVSLSFVSTHMPTCAIEGYIEDFLPNLFSKDPEIQMSIICPKPDFIGEDLISLTGPTVVSGTTPGPTWINYQGTVETGVDLVVQKGSGEPDIPTGIVKVEFMETLPAPDWVADRSFIVASIQVDTTHYFKLRSIIGDKYIQEIHTVSGGPPVTNLLPYLQVTNQDWPVLKPGMNFFNFIVVSTAMIGVGPSWTMSYYPRYGGL